MGRDATSVAIRLIGFALVILSAVHCTASPEPGIERPPTPPPATKEPVEDMSLTIVYDNNVYDPHLRTAWGFACWLQRGETSVLFDTGGDPEMLLANMNVLGLDPQDIDVIVLSHIHGDHTGGLMGLLSTGARPPVYVPAAFPTQFKAAVRELVAVHEVHQAQEILPGIHTTGEIGTDIREQGLIVQTNQGIVVITGCAHPGIVEIVRQAQAVLDDQVYLVTGGFHLGGASVSRIREVSLALQQLGVQKLAPCHCTGEEAMHIFATEFGDNYIPCGAGRTIQLIP